MPNTLFPITKAPTLLVLRCLFKASDLEPAAHDSWPRPCQSGDLQMWSYMRVLGFSKAPIFRRQLGEPGTPDYTSVAPPPKPETLNPKLFRLPGELRSASHGGSGTTR